MKALGDSFVYTGTAAEEQANRLAVLEAAYSTAQTNVEKYKYLLDESIKSSGAASEMSQYLAEKLTQEESTLESAKKALDDYTDSLDESKQAAAKLETAQIKLNKSWSSSAAKGVKSLLADIKNLDLSGAVQDLAALAWRRLDAETKQDIVDTAQGWIDTLDEAFASEGFSGLAKAGSTIAESLLAGLKDELPKIGEQIGIDLSGFVSGDGSLSILSGLAQALSSLGPEALLVIAAVAAAVIAIGGLVAAISSAASEDEEFQQTLADIRTGIQNTIGEFLEQVKEIFEPTLESLKPLLEAIGQLLQSILKFAGMLITSVLQVLEPIITAIVTVLEPVVELLTTLVNIISGVLKPALEVLGTVLEWLLTPIQWVANAIKAIFSGLINFINGILKVLNKISIFGWHPFDFDLIDSPWDDDDGGSGGSGGSGGGSGSGTITQAYQSIDEVDKYAAAIQSARESALQNAQQSAQNLSNGGGEQSSSSFLDKLKGILKEVVGTAQIVVPVEIDGQEFARVTAPYIDEELDARI